MRFRPLFFAAIAAAATLGAGSASHAGKEVKLVILKEHGVGSSAQAQPFVDKLVAIAAKKQGWSAAKGSYFTDRKAAETAMDADKPDFGILSLPAYLALKEKRHLDTIGQVAVANGGGQQYFLISRDAKDLAGCKGKKLASDHADDPIFIDRVVSGGAFKLGDFTLEVTRRPVQTIKKVANGEAVCALIDDAQLAELAHVEGAAGVKQVWSSAKLPPMAVVAFQGVDKPTKDGFKAALGNLCAGEGQPICKEIGIQSLTSAGDDAYAQILAAYKKDK